MWRLSSHCDSHLRVLTQRGSWAHTALLLMSGNVGRGGESGASRGHFPEEASPRPLVLCPVVSRQGWQEAGGGPGGAGPPEGSCRLGASSVLTPTQQRPHAGPTCPRGSAALSRNLTTPLSRAGKVRFAHLVSSGPAFLIFWQMTPALVTAPEYGHGWACVRADGMPVTQWVSPCYMTF